MPGSEYRSSELRSQSRRGGCGEVRRIHHPGSGACGPRGTLRHERQLRKGPQDPAIPQLGLREDHRLSLERSGQERNPVALGDLLPRIALIQGLDQNQGGRRVGPPGDAADSRQHGVAGAREIFAERGVVDAAHDFPVARPDLGAGWEQAHRHLVGIGALHGAHEQVLAVRRGRHRFMDARLAQARHRALLVHPHDLVPEVILEQGFVMRVS